MQFTFYGHACFSVEMGGKHLLFDPFISGNELAKHINLNAIPADYILISHGHGDHVADAPAIAKRTQATIVSNFEIVSWFEHKHHHPKGHPMNHGGEWQFDFGKVKYVNAVHSSVLPDGSYGGNPGGFIVSGAEGAFYFAGDTALTWDMKLIPMFANLNFAVLPIGNNFTMGINDAIIAAEFIECETIIGVHYDTFGYIKIDHQQATLKFAERGLKLLLPDIGETIEV